MVRRDTQICGSAELVFFPPLVADWKFLVTFLESLWWDVFFLPEMEVINGISLSSTSPEDSGTVSRRASGGWMDNMSPQQQQQQQDNLSRGGAQQENKRVGHFSPCMSLIKLMDGSDFNCNRKEVVIWNELNGGRLSLCQDHAVYLLFWSVFISIWTNGADWHMIECFVNAGERLVQSSRFYPGDIRLQKDSPTAEVVQNTTDYIQQEEYSSGAETWCPVKRL